MSGRGIARLQPSVSLPRKALTRPGSSPLDRMGILLLVELELILSDGSKGSAPMGVLVHAFFPVRCLFAIPPSQMFSHLDFILGLHWMAGLPPKQKLFNEVSGSFATVIFPLGY